MAYLTYTEYTGMGGTLQTAAFSRIEFRARRLIDTLTHGRVRTEQTVRDAVKYAAFELVVAMTGDAGNNGREVQSVSNDGIAVSYADTGGAQARYTEIVCGYLANEATAAGVPLLYAGVDA